MLSGAKFKLCKDSEGKDIVNLTGENGIYRLLEAGEAGSSTTEVVSQASNLTGKDFNIYINGLRAGTYWLVETEAPEGYNKAEPIKIVITRTGSGENEWKVSADGLENNDNNKIVRIENNKGGLLPETGGMGTILFTIAGLTLILIAVFGMRKRKEEN